MHHRLNESIYIKIAFSNVILSDHDGPFKRQAWVEKCLSPHEHF